MKLAEKMRRAVREQKHLADPNIAPPAQFVVTPEGNAAMVKKLFDEKFPPGTQFGTPPAGFFRSLIAAVTFRPQRERRAARQENARRAAEHEKAVTAAAAAGLPVEEMSGRLAEAITVDENDLHALAQARAQRVRDDFTGVGRISADRLFLAKDQAAAAKAGKGPRVMLTLQ